MSCYHDLQIIKQMNRFEPVKPTDLKTKKYKFQIEIRKKKKFNFFKQNRKMFVERIKQAQGLSQQLDPNLGGVTLASPSQPADSFSEDEKSIRQAKLVNQIEVILRNIDDAYKMRDMDSLANYIRQLRLLTSSTQNPEKFPYKEIFHTKAFEIVLICLEKDTNMGHRKVIEETLWMISNMMLSPQEYLLKFLRDDLLFKMALYLDLGSITSVRSIFWSLSNILAELPDQINLIIEHGYIDFLLNNSREILEDRQLEETVAWFISNVFRPQVKVNSTIKFGILDKYFEIFFGDINSVAMLEITTAVRDFVDPSCERFADRCLLVLQKNPVERLVELCYSNNITLKNTALEIMGKMSYADEHITSIFVTEEIREMLIFHVHNRGQCASKQTMKYAVWVLSNLVMDSTENCMFFSTNHLLGSLVNIIQDNLAAFKRLEYSSDLGLETDDAICNSQYNMFALIHNIYSKVNGKAFRNKLLNELSLVDLILECLEVENWKVIEFLLEFLQKILDNAAKDFSER